ncbi:MAG: SDR family NAD(P)-dependent oxidoreductase [Elusimicrobia bacterium]|nr:SDR family NAD(P)-dependent oxidoreductase [Elusimicrobiota bacterium]
MKGLRVLITGATSGLGEAMALQLAREGCRLALTGRREDRLADVARRARALGAECLELPGNVADPASSEKHYARIVQAWDGLDWAILNSGVGGSASGRKFSAKGFVDLFSINVFGVAYWIERVLPGMLASREGTIAVISSLAAWRGLPRAASYCSSKAALNVLLESLRVDLRGTGVSIVTVCPGYIKSELTAKRDFRRMPFLLQTEDGARRILHGIRAKKRLVAFPAPMAWFMRLVLGPMPGFLYERLAGLIPHSND